MTGRFFACGGALTLRNKQSSSPGPELKPYIAGVCAAPDCGQSGGWTTAWVMVLFSDGAGV